MTFEQRVDALVQRRLGNDPAYRNAANAQEQAEREEEITREVIATIIEGDALRRGER